MDNWSLFIFLAGLVAAWSVVMMGVQKYMMAAGFRALGEQIGDIRKATEKIEKFERELLEMKADLPLNYVRREDAIRQETVMTSKLDTLAAKIDALRAEHYRWREDYDESHE